MKVDKGRLSSPGVWEKVLTLIGDCSKLRVLDAPAGGGELSNALRERGVDVVSLDIGACEGKKNWIQADLNKTLPFTDSSFDRIVSVEGIEHLENPFFLLREFYRLVKDGGYVVVTTPNTVNLRSRLKFLLTGNLFWFGASAIDSFGHIMPMMPSIIRYASKKAGFKNVEIHVSRRLPFLNFLSKAYRLFSWSFSEEENEAQLLAGEILVLKLSK